MEYVQFAITIILILLVFYFADSVKKKQNKELKKMQDNLKVGDKIVTYSGLSGKVVEVEEERILVSLSPNDTEIYIEKWAVAGLDDRTLDSNANDKKEDKTVEDNK